MDIQKIIKKVRFIAIIFTFVFVIVFGAAFGINLHVKKFSEKYIFDNITNIEDFDCILVLGAGLKDANTPSDILNERIKKGIELYKSGLSSKIIMSGDHGRNDYDEVNVMKQTAIDNYVLSSDVFMDHAGFSTYDSIYRAKEIFKSEKIIIVSQKYHLYRAVYIANKIGIEAYGVAAEDIYSGQFYRDFREFIAINKDFFKVILKPKSKYVGEAIPVSGNGDVTNDKPN